MRRVVNPLTVLLAAAACSRAPEPPAATPTPTPLPALTEADIEMLLAVERALAEEAAAREQARRRQGRAIALTEELRPRPSDVGIEEMLQRLGYDGTAYWRARQRLGELQVLRVEAHEREQTRRFREAHLEVLRRALEGTADDDERQRIAASIAAVEHGLERDAAADRHLDAIAPELALLDRYSAASDGD